MTKEKLLETLSHEGAVAIVTWAEGEAHVSNTWNSYVQITEDDRLLIPAAGMKKTQKNIDQNPKVKLTLGSRETMGFWSMGTGFLIEGIAKFVETGAEYTMMKEKFPFLSRVLEITPTTIKQTL
ncbi:MAG: pyridoxamine 5'-phosphate oxidase family protein [Gorillibacterium sp.]|nr:pyridoxamine 5'-phosphate oxidase family protein [Gorillibacterium sp.]